MFVDNESRIFPLRIEIEPTNNCNSRCSYCPRRFMDYKKGFMDMGFYRRLIDEISAYPHRTLVLFRRGEALMHPEFPRMLEYTKDKFKQVQLATNASLMGRDIAHIIAKYVTNISFSLELPGRYKKYRGPDFETTSRNISYFLSINKKTDTQVSMVKTGDVGDDDINRFKDQWLGKVDRVRVYREHSKDGRFGSLNRSRGKRAPCVKPFNDILIFWDGKVGRCNHDWGSCPLGSLENETIKDLWQGSVYRNLRKEHLSLDIGDEVCKGCDSWYEQLSVCKIGQVYEKE